MIYPATAKEIEDFTGEKVTQTQQAFMVKDGEEPIGIIGFHQYHTRFILFSYIKPEIELKQYRRHVIKAYRKVMGILKTKSLPVLSYADEVEGADRLLEHIGFKRLIGRTYQWHG